MYHNINQAQPLMMHVDLNSCFATIEQQSRPLLRNRPVAVVNRRTEKTAIITASYEAKRLGVKVGMKLTTARLLCPDLVAVETDPPKYRFVYHKLMNILMDYSPVAKMKSIDEGLIDLSQSPPYIKRRRPLDVGREIKERLRLEIGDYMSCNVGIGTNRFLAKTAAGINKPDGLTQIDQTNLIEIYSQLKLTDLTGIASGYSRRLNQIGIKSVIDFFEASEEVLDRQVFHGKCGRDWYRRLRGWEVDVDEHSLQSVGRQFVLDERDLGSPEVLRRFHMLSEDVAAKLRLQKRRAKGVRIYVKTYHSGYWQNLYRQERAINDEQSLFEVVKELFNSAPLPAYEIGVTCYGLVSDELMQTDLFGEDRRADNLSGMIDEINLFWGSHAIHSADTLGLGDRMKQKIPFGSTRYL